jgi:hypothetical protein
MLFAIDDRGIPGRHALRFVLKGALVSHPTMLGASGVAQKRGPAVLGRDRFRRRGGRQLGDPPLQGGVQGAAGTQEEGGAPAA